MLFDIEVQGLIFLGFPQNQALTTVKHECTAFWVFTLSYEAGLVCNTMNTML